MSKLFEQLNLESVTIDFTDSPVILERIFGPDEYDIPEDWYNQFTRNLPSLINFIPMDWCRLTKMSHIELQNQFAIARAILDCAYKYNANPYGVFYDHEEKTLELQFSFETLHAASLFHSGLRDYVEENTGLIL